MIEEVIEVVSDILSPVYLVGGAVRDFVMEREVTDWDFTTPLTPDEIEAALLKNNAGRKIWASGKQFGTLGTKVYLPKEDCFVKIEITTFREETYSSSRKPQVEFVTSIDQDLMRRDFTINAMAVRLKKNYLHVIDPYGGIPDLEHSIIRAVGHARQRFKEDPLRMLRAARFASAFGFEIEELTKKRMAEGSLAILRVSKERWVQELDKLLMGDYVVNGLNILAETRLLHNILPELSVQIGYDQMTPHHDFTLWEHTYKVVEAVPKNINLKWAALLHDVGKPFAAIVKPNNPAQKNYPGHELIGKEIAEKIGRYLKWPKERIDWVSDAVGCHLEERSPLKGYDSGAQKRMNITPEIKER